MARPASRIALVLLPLVMLSGCLGGTLSGEPGTSPTIPSEPTRFDGEANAHVTVFNGANETWSIQYQIVRDGDAVLDQSGRIEPGSQWNVTTIEQPGNYTFTVEFENGSRLQQSVRLPRAVGERDTFVSVKSDEGRPELIIYWEQ